MEFFLPLITREILISLQPKKESNQKKSHTMMKINDQLFFMNIMDTP